MDTPVSARSSPHPWKAARRNRGATVSPFEHVYGEVMDETCGAIHVSPTAVGDVEVPCKKPTGHVECGDPQHEGKVGAFPVRWRD